MFNQSTSVAACRPANTANKKQIYCLLSAVVLMMYSPLAAQAADSNYSNNNSAIATVSPVIVCDSKRIAKPNHTKPTFYTKSTATERHTIDRLLTQLELYQQKTLNTRQQYFAYKAQAWLNYVSYENSIKSKSAAGKHALKSSAIILQALQSNSEEQLPLITNIPSTSALMRPDLWATLSALKESALKEGNGAIIAPRELAFSEVALVWAAADQCQHGSRGSGAQFRMAERWLEQARETYVNVHDSKVNVELEDLINSYYQLYAPLDAHDDTCYGQVLPVLSQNQ